MRQIAIEIFLRELNLYLPMFEVNASSRCRQFGKVKLHRQKSELYMHYPNLGSFTMRLSSALTFFMIAMPKNGPQ